jgi:phosphoesterase RecJ-like protein
MATCLFAAVLTDTGSFTYQCTSATTLRLATHLVEAGASPNEIAQQVYFSNPASKMHLLGKALGHLQVEDGLAWSWVTLDDMLQSGADIEDCEGVVNHLISIAGVRAAVFLRELSDGTARLSIRSKGRVNVAKVAESFGGGGHRNASGCTIAGPLDAARAAVLVRLRAQTT